MGKILIDMAEKDYNLEHLQGYVDPIGPSQWVGNSYMLNTNHHLVDISMLNDIAIAIAGHCDWLDCVDRKVCQVQIMSCFLYLLQSIGKSTEDFYTIATSNYVVYCKYIFQNYVFTVKVRK